MIILGIDPGYAIVGIGVIEFSGNKFKPLEYNAITTPAGMAVPDRLQAIYQGVEHFINKYKPDAVAIEELFFNTNLTTGIAVAHGRGVLLLACQQAGVEIFEYTPLQVKQSVVGYGRADKKQVMDMVKRLCNLTAAPKPDDAADAVALALCHARSSTSLLFKGEKDKCSTI